MVVLHAHVGNVRNQVCTKLYGRSPWYTSRRLGRTVSARSGIIALARRTHAPIRICKLQEGFLGIAASPNGRKRMQCPHGRARNCSVLVLQPASPRQVGESRSTSVASLLAPQFVGCKEQNASAHSQTLRGDMGQLACGYHSPIAEGPFIAHMDRGQWHPGVP